MNFDKLYYSPVANQGAASFIAAFVGGIDMACESVDVLEKKTSSGVDYGQICRNHSLPCITTSGGAVLTEEPVVLTYIADKVFGVNALELIFQ